jgi:NADPH:quinone reductase-like Zn-dependent oxidoreductase
MTYRSLVTKAVLDILYWASVTHNVNRFLPIMLGGTPGRFVCYPAAANLHDQKQFAELIKEGKIQPVIDRVFTLLKMEGLYF